ncbi:hypothetical protein EYF80_049458 [Liparis tanakae]|uniref:Uncharacterized protein n=1 Tax=Liparis tanakae TaxID=230148 RepID=A0A4Z2FGQ6_9TELE|nr:hypothetical protein EYF80_049458 [Liparis tanakae]
MSRFVPPTYSTVTFEKRNLNQSNNQKNAIDFLFGDKSIKGSAATHRVVGVSQNQSNGFSVSGSVNNHIRRLRNRTHSEKSAQAFSAKPKRQSGGRNRGVAAVEKHNKTRSGEEVHVSVGWDSSSERIETAAEKEPERNTGGANRHNGIKPANQGRRKTAACTQEAACTRRPRAVPKDPQKAGTLHTAGLL